MFSQVSVCSQRGGGGYPWSYVLLGVGISVVGCSVGDVRYVHGARYVRRLYRRLLVIRGHFFLPCCCYVSIYTLCMYITLSRLCECCMNTFMHMEDALSYYKLVQSGS